MTYHPGAPPDARHAPGLYRNNDIDPRPTMSKDLYDLIGKRVRVHLYSRGGQMLGALEGRVADVAFDVPVADGMTKDLAYVVDIETGDPETPYRNSAGDENEGWFAVQDLEVVQPEKPRFFAN